MNTVTPRPIHKVLIANRGEIAVRIIRGCYERGIDTVAVFEADREALHVDGLGGRLHRSCAEQRIVSRAEVILEVARQTGADAIHPGYGFLSENASFARAVQAAGLVWIGPPASAIDAMGSKTASRQLMAAAGVPIVPGTTEPLGSVEEAERVAAEIGFPVMLKAAAGGGGKGMRRVMHAEELASAFRAARSEAASSFVMRPFTSRNSS